MLYFRNMYIKIKNSSHNVKNTNNKKSTICFKKFQSVPFPRERREPDIRLQIGFKINLELSNILSAEFTHILFVHSIFFFTHIPSAWKKYNMLKLFKCKKECLAFLCLLLRWLWKTFVPHYSQNFSKFIWLHSK